MHRGLSSFCILFILSFLLSSCTFLLEYIGGKALDCALSDECLQSQTSPENAVTSYYQLINAREYEQAWVMLTPRFQGAASENEYRGFEEWWNSVEVVEISFIELVSESNNGAAVNVSLTYKMLDGRVVEDSQYKFLLLPGVNGNWLIDRVMSL